MAINTASLSVNDPGINLGVALEINCEENSATMRLFWPAKKTDITADLAQIEGLTRFGKHGSSTEQRSMTLGPVMFGDKEELMTVNLAFAEAKRVLGETKFWQPLTTVALFLEKGQSKLTATLTAGELRAIEISCEGTFSWELRRACIRKLEEIFKDVSYDYQLGTLVVLLSEKPRKTTEAIAAAMTAMRCLDKLDDSIFVK